MARVPSFVFVLALVACSDGASSAPAPTKGCETPIRGAPGPAWAPTAPSGLRWIADDGNRIAGFLFSDPLRAGRPQNPSNKILWVANGPRNGSPLAIALHPVDATRPLVTDSFPANSSPAEIYPSIVDVPTPGCWHATLRWNGRTAELDLPFV